MKQLFLTILIFFCVSSIAFSQLDTSSLYKFRELKGSYFAYLYGDRVIKGKQIYSRDPLFKSLYVQVDETKYKGDMVKFYQNEQGFFANISAFSYRSTFIPCVEMGKINLFEYERTNHNPGNFNQTTGMYNGGMSTRSYKYYYNAGFGHLKEANYANLSMDLQDSPAAMLHLESYRKQKRMANGLTIGGLALVAAGSISIISKFANTPRGGDVPGLGIEFGLIGAGGIASWVAYFMGLDNRDKLIQAARTYNHGF